MCCQLQDLLGLAYLVGYSSGIAGFCSFSLSFSGILTWICSYGVRKVSRTTKRSILLNVLSTFQKSLFYVCCCLNGWSMTGAKPRALIGRNVEGNRDRMDTWTAWVCCLKLCHTDFEKWVTLTLQSTCTAQAWKDVEGRHLLCSGTVSSEDLGAIRCPLGLTIVPDGISRWSYTSGTTSLETVHSHPLHPALESEGKTC